MSSGPYPPLVGSPFAGEMAWPTVPLPYRSGEEVRRWSSSMKRIALIGNGGSGKSTVARQLGVLLGLPVYHLDALLWKPGWVPTTDEESIPLQRDLVARESWIIDGNYGSTMDI